MNSTYVQLRSIQAVLEAYPDYVPRKGLGLPDFEKANAKCKSCDNAPRMYQPGGDCAECANAATQEELFPMWKEPR